ncbi:adenylate cyclase, partial [Salmonella enterica subsp. enterica serovar Takoradi]|nr:adenylate cyclase [Salmonella enterica subsp. enterica serovar Takoradi]
PAVIDGFACEGIIQFFFETTEDNNVFNIYILDEANRVEIYSHCEGSKEELVKDVSRFYSSSHDRFTYGSSFINFNLPQFYQIVKVDGATQVLPFAGGSFGKLSDLGKTAPKEEMSTKPIQGFNDYQAVHHH